MSRRTPFVIDALRELRRIAHQYVTADPRRLCGPDGTALRLCDVPDDIAAAIQEVQFDKDGRLQRVGLVDKARAAKLLMRQRNVWSRAPIVSSTGSSQPAYSAASAFRSPGAVHDSSESRLVGTKATMFINRPPDTG
jgi:hypothetical protein